MSLFGSVEKPLAWRMQPEDIEDFVGQTHLLAPGRPLRRLIEEDRLVSVIFYGPPGTGKTSLSRIIAKRTRALFLSINAVTAFALVPALSSRSMIFQFYPLKEDEIIQILKRALTDRRGLGEQGVAFSDDVLRYIASFSEGDARRALNILELAYLISEEQEGKRLLTIEKVKEALQNKAIYYDEQEHYDTISAFIKSMRGSDPDATVYWLAKMLEAGEDPLFIARRIVICASEDVGNADPHALVIAQAALEATEKTGMPEARIILLQAALYVAQAPKSKEVRKTSSVCTTEEDLLQIFLGRL